MATVKSGIMGDFSGKVGNIVGYHYKSQFCIRKMPVRSSKPPTAAQLAQRAKFGLSIRFLTGLRPLLSELPDRGKKQISAFNSCLASILKSAVKGTYPDFLIDYASVRLTSGSLFSGCRHSVVADQTRLIFSWCPGVYNCRLEGRAVLLAYNPAKGQWIYHLSGAASEDRMAELYLPCNFKGDTVETYLFFVSDGCRAASGSVYTGPVQIAGSFVCGPEQLSGHLYQDQISIDKPINR
jgi:hypothetical protein